MDTERDAVERLGYRIVQFACQSLPLLNGRQLLRLLIKLCVLNRNRCLVGNRKGECGVMLCKGIRFTCSQDQHADHLVSEHQRNDHAGTDGVKSYLPEIPYCQAKGLGQGRIIAHVLDDDNRLAGRHGMPNQSQVLERKAQLHQLFFWDRAPVIKEDEILPFRR